MGLADMWDKMFGLPAIEQDLAIIQPEKPKTDPIKALVHLVKMDMKMYPSEWRRKDDDCYHVYRNDKAELIIKINQLKAMRSGEHCEINGIEVGHQYVEDIERVFQQRDLQSLLEKILDRVEKIEKVDVKQLQEAKRLELVDPFTVRDDHLVSIQKALTAIEAAGTSSMMPTRTRIALPTPKPGPPPSCRPISSRVILPTKSINMHVDTWKGVPINELTDEQYNDYMQYMDRKIANA